VLSQFARDEGITAAHFSGVGAFENVSLLYWDPDTHQPDENPINEQVEVASLNGNITRLGDGPDVKVHAHVVLGRRNGTALAGHLGHASVQPTLEILLTSRAATLTREHDDETNMDLIR
jgi:predicted DNA-binding protein with PD1-like motif